MQDPIHSPATPGGTPGTLSSHLPLRSLCLSNDLTEGWQGPVFFQARGFQDNRPWGSAPPAGTLNGETHINLTAEAVFRLFNTYLLQSILQISFVFYKQEIKSQRSQTTFTTTHSKLEAGLGHGLSLLHPYTLHGPPHHLLPPCL